MGNRVFVACCIILASALFTGILPPLAGAVGGGDSCLACHGNQEKMRALGYPHFAVTREEAERQTGMPAGCADCHRGNPSQPDREKAHDGMGRLLLVRKKGLIAEPADRKIPLELGSNPLLRIRYLTGRDGKSVVDTTVNTILYQDKRRDTLSQDFDLMEKTCGTCHRAEFEQFRQSTMGRNAKQSSYRSWADRERGPHNCGVWFDGNYEKTAAATVVPFPREVNDLNQRQCNSCHVGCLDCHYFPMAQEPADPKKGVHSFIRTPKPESCYGGGRGTICHAGPEERRRGAGYFGGPFSYPEGMDPDVHLAKKLGCLDCHESNRDGKGLGHGMVRREGSCTRCHGEAVTSHARSVHRNLSCEACHVTNVAGYQGTFWGPGNLAGSPTPFFKYKDYYGVMKEPVLIRDQGGRWIPVKPYAMAVMNQKESGLAPGLHWRWPKGLPSLSRTDDAWGYAGLVGGLPEGNKALLWIQMDKVSHKYGKSRLCISCHGLPNGEQRQNVTWDYSDAGAMPFTGSHTVVAGRQGLFIRDMKSDDKIDVLEGFSLSSFAPWFYLGNAWSIRGDFALPLIRDRETFEAAKADVDQARRRGVIHR